MYERMQTMNEPKKKKYNKKNPDRNSCPCKAACTSLDI